MDNPEEKVGAVVGAFVLALVFSDIIGCTEYKSTLAEREQEKQNLEKASIELAKAERGLAYACGYLHGQRAIIFHAGLKFKPPELLEKCPRYTDEAIEAGFVIAKRNR